MNDLYKQMYEDYIEMLEKIINLRREFDLKIIESIKESKEIENK